MPQVLRLFRAPKRGLPMEELSEIAALEEVGFENCAHAQPGGKRQVLLVDRETLDALELGPGMILRRTSPRKGSTLTVSSRANPSA